MIYLASPYTHPDPRVRQARFVAVCQVTGLLMATGLKIYSPIAQSHSIVMHHVGDTPLPSDWSYWSAYDTEVLTRLCDEIYVLQLGGWADSAGVAAEVALMQHLGRPVSYLAAPVVIGGVLRLRAPVLMDVLLGRSDGHD